MKKTLAIILAAAALAGCAPTYSYYDEGYYRPHRHYYTPRYERRYERYGEREYRRCPRVPPAIERDNLDCRLQQDGCIKCWE